MRKSGSPGRLHSGKEHSPIHTREPNLSTGVGEQMSPSTLVDKAPDGEATQDSRPNGLKWAKGKFRKLCWAYWKAHGESGAKSRQNASQDARRRFQMGQAK